MYGSGNTSPAPFGAAGLNGGGERVEKESKDAVVYKVDSMNEFESNQTIVINETDFLVLMMKRKVLLLMRGLFVWYWWLKGINN